MFVAQHVGTPDQYLVTSAGPIHLPSPAVAAQYLTGCRQTAPVQMDAAALGIQWQMAPGTAAVLGAVGAEPTATVDVKALTAALVAALPTPPALTEADVEAAVRAVLHGA